VERILTLEDAMSGNLVGLSQRSAALGLAVWLVALLILEPGWAVALFLLAPLVLVPLALAAITASDRHLSHPERWRWVLFGQPPAAWLLVAAFFVPAGPWAAALAVPWMCVTGLIGLTGLIHAWPWKNRTFDELCMYAGMIYLPVGATWVVLARCGVRPLGFSDLIVLATAVHFHYAGFILPLLTGLASRLVSGAMARSACAAVVLGVPAVAAGITLSAFDSHLLEWLAAWFMCLACFLVLGLQVRLALRAGSWLFRSLLALSAGALGLAMSLAGIYALGSYWGTPWLSIEAMLPWHGATNALGTALCGLLAWNLAPAKVPHTPKSPTWGPCGHITIGAQRKVFP
jgi:YndJ-like protein